MNVSTGKDVPIMDRKLQGLAIPSSPEQLIKNLSAALNEDMLLRTHFFTEDALLRLTGATAIEFKGYRPDWITAFPVGLERLLNSATLLNVDRPIIGLRLRWVDLTSGGSNVQVSFSISQSLPELNFESVTVLIGKDWRKEQQFIRPRRYHNRLPPTHPMGNSRIVYKRSQEVTDLSIEAAFWADGNLKRLNMFLVRHSISCR